MAYIPKDWSNLPIEDTPIMAEDLDHIENGIANVDTRLTTVETNQGTLTNLTTTEKTNLVGAINEVEARVDTTETDINNLQLGWDLLSGTFVFLSWDATVKTLVVTTSVNQTGIINLGDKLKYTHSATTKFAIVTAVTSTTLTLFLGTDYTVSSGNLTNVYYSHMKSPYGFPINPDKWSVTVSDTTTRSQSSPVANTWYNLGGVNISIPIGLWKVGYKNYSYIERATGTGVALFVTLSTTNNGQSNASNTMACYTATVLGMAQSFVLKDMIMNLTSKTTHYINTMTDSTGITSMNNSNAQSTLILKAVCAYL